MVTHVALLRGINLGGHNKVAIDLVKTKIRELLRERGVDVDAPIVA